MQKILIQTFPVATIAKYQFLFLAQSNTSNAYYFIKPVRIYQLGKGD